MNNYQLRSIEETDLSGVFFQGAVVCLLLAVILLEIAAILLGVRW